MGSFFYGLSLIFPRLLDHTVEISVLICLIFLVKVLAPKKLPPWWHYSLWLLLLVRMLVPLQFENRLNVFNFVPAVSTPHVSELIAQKPIEGAMPVQPVVPKAQVVEADIRFAVNKSIPLLWLTGAMVLGVCIIFESLSFWRSVRRRPKVTDEAVLALLSECKSRMKIKRNVDIIVTDNVRCPALFGYLKPRLLLPEGIFEKLNDRELAYAFMHELGHLKRHDIGVSWLIALLQVIHWFNPLVWLAFYQIRVDQESACDAAVLSRMKHNQSADYAKAIVGFLEKFCQNCQLPALAGVLENRSQMKKRIAKIVQYRKTSQRLSFVAGVLLASAGFLLFTLTGVAAEKRQIGSLDSAMVMAPPEGPGIVMAGGPGDTKAASDAHRMPSPGMTDRLPQDKDFHPVMQPETPVAKVSVASMSLPKNEMAVEVRTVPDLAVEESPVAEITYAALADISGPRPSSVSGSEPVGFQGPDAIEKTATIPAASEMPGSADSPSAVGSEKRQAPTSRTSGQMTAGRQQTPAVVASVPALQASGGEGAAQERRTGNPADLQKSAGPAPSAYEIDQMAQGDTARQFNHLETETQRPAGVGAAAVIERPQTPDDMMHRDLSAAASTTAKREAGPGAGAFQAAEVDTPPRLIKAYPPRYPYMAKRDDISGSITLQFVVTKDGNAVDTTVVESDPKGVFDEAVLQAIEQYRFKPGIKDGKAVDVKVNLPIKFNLT